MKEHFGAHTYICIYMYIHICKYIYIYEERYLVLPCLGAA